MSWKKWFRYHPCTAIVIFLVLGVYTLPKITETLSPQIWGPGSWTIHFNKDADLHAILVLTKQKTHWSMRCFAVILSKRQQGNLLANFWFQKRSKTNNSEEQHEASSLADSNLRTDTTAASADLRGLLPVKGSQQPGPEWPWYRTSQQRLEMGLKTARRPMMTVSPPASLSLLTGPAAVKRIPCIPPYVWCEWERRCGQCIFRH